ncbi:MAG: glycosyltransferase family 4 protein, partial [Nitrososphaeraceae archaeon]
MKILIFSWKDIKTPFAGGAEVYTYEISKRLVKKGHDVTLVTPRFTNCSNSEIIDGIKIIRYGGKYTLFLRAKYYYRKYLKQENFDIIIDQINTVPFFTTSYISNKKVVCLIYQLSREFWFREIKFPINFLGYYFFELAWLKRYRKFPTITISQSTKSDLEKINFKNINIVPVGISAPIFPQMKTNKNNGELTLVYLGRLTKTKKTFDVLKAFEIVNEKYPNIKLSIIGDGYLKKNLMKYANSMKYGSNITFHGFLNEKEKFTILSNANLLVVSGVREGWGMVVTEANSVGIPAIGYNIPGLRDSIIDGKTGLLCETNPEDMAKKIVEFFKDKILQEKLAKEALEYSHKFTWDKSTEE